MNYSKFLLGILLFALTTNAGAATQTSEESIFRTRPKIGIQAGATFSNVSGPSDISTSNRKGFAAGVNFEIPISYFFSIQPEALYLRRGVELGRLFETKIVAKYDSLQFPLLAKFKVDQSVSPFLVIGPVMTLNVSKSYEVDSPNGYSSVKFSPRTWEMDGLIGAGVDLGPLFASLHFVWGLTDLDEGSSDWRTRQLDLLAGFRF